MSFKIIKKSKTTKARAGILETAHGPIETPVFMPVGTQATVKSITPEQVMATGAQIILANTYHLSLRPGVDLIQKSGGLHSFMNWDQPILTDSGGFQVFSLAKLRKIKEAGVEFQSHIDGSSRFFTPESVIDLQRGFGSDIMMPLDICSPYPCARDQLLHDLEITTKWEAKAKDYWEKNTNNQLLFAIVQGGMEKDLREKSAKDLINIDFPGYAIGGVSVGEPAEKMNEVVAFTTPFLPEDKPRYLMGVGYPENLEYAIHQGIDMFDCVIPTRLARHGQVFTHQGRINIKNKQYFEDLSPIDLHCQCYTCQHYSKAYLRHLAIANEMLACTLMTIHNIFHLVQLVKDIRAQI